MSNELAYLKVCGQSLTPDEADERLEKGLWNQKVIGLDKAHEISRGEEVIIALIDSGVDAAHDNLKDVIVGRRICLKTKKQRSLGMALLLQGY